MPALSKRTVFWTLYLGMVLTLPVLVFLFQVYAIVPLAGVLRFTLVNLHGSIRFGVWLLLHILVYGGILAGVAAFLTRWIFKASAESARRIAVVAALAMCVLVAWSAPYAVGGHANDERLPWIRAIFSW